MTEYNLDSLKGQSKDTKEALTARQRELYRYAREKGFTSYEAIVLKSKDKETIDRLAAERDRADGKG